MSHFKVLIPERYGRKHPECKPNELFIGNTLFNGSYPHPQWKRWRLGTIAKDIHGKDISHIGFRPLFVPKIEVLRRYADIFRYENGLLSETTKS